MPQLSHSSFVLLKSFPAKIHAILCRSDLHHIISWLPHGRSWQVMKPKEFESEVIPQYFEHTRYSSFVRQANGKPLSVDIYDHNHHSPSDLIGFSDSRLGIPQNQTGTKSEFVLPSHVLKRPTPPSKDNETTVHQRSEEGSG